MSKLDWEPESFYTSPGARERYLEAKQVENELIIRKLRNKLAFSRAVLAVLVVVVLALWMSK